METTEKQLHRKYIIELAEQTKTQQIPGVFVECGVKHGGSAIRIVNILRCPSFLFDTWRRFKGATEIDCGKKRLKRLATRDGRAAEKNCRRLFKKKNLNQFCKMIKGDVRKTIPRFVKAYSELTYNFVHLDLDLCAPTQVCLEHLWPRLCGPVFVHDYGSRAWKGVKHGVDKFVKKQNANLFVYPDISACIIRK